MRFAITLLSIIACSAFADQEFYRGDIIYYAQPGAAKKPGFISFPAGTYERIGAGDLYDIALRITPTEIQLMLPGEKETFTAEKRQSFLSGEMIALSSGRKVQFFRPIEKMPHQLLLYSARGGLNSAIHLIEKKP